MIGCRRYCIYDTLGLDQKQRTPGNKWIHRTILRRPYILNDRSLIIYIVSNIMSEIFGLFLINLVRNVECHTFISFFIIIGIIVCMFFLLQNLLGNVSTYPFLSRTNDFRLFILI